MTSYRSGLRTTAEDFLGADFIDPALSVTRRPGTITFDYLTCFTLGPTAIADADAGPVARPWRIRAVGNAIYIARSNDARTDWEPDELLFTIEGEPPLEIDATFEQNARPVVCVERNTGVGEAPEVWIYYYKPADAAFVFESFGSGRSPKCLLDDPLDETNSDVFVFYVRDGEGIVYRLQRDLYAVRYTTPVNVWEGRYVEEVLYAKWYRMVVVYSIRDGTDTWTLGRLESTLYPVPADSDAMSLGLMFLDENNELRQVIITHDQLAEDALSVGLDLLVSTLADVVITYDEEGDVTPLREAISQALDFTVDSSLNVVVIVDDEIEEAMDLGLDFVSGGTSSLILAVITHNQPTTEAVQPTITITGGSLAVVP